MCDCDGGWWCDCLGAALLDRHECRWQLCHRMAKRSLEEQLVVCTDTQFDQRLPQDNLRHGAQ